MNGAFYKICQNTQLNIRHAGCSMHTGGNFTNNRITPVLHQHNGRLSNLGRRDGVMMVMCVV